MGSRRVLGLVVAALAGGAPSADIAAAADCATSPVLCVGAAKVTERVQAECRRAGACPAVDLAAYRASWAHRAHAFQRVLGDELPLANAPWVGTHNSFNSTAAFPTLSRTDSNQQLTLTDQLELDVRSLELDVHWILGRPVVCHGRDADQLHAGCTLEEPLGEPLREIAAWLDAHPREVLLLYLEDDLGADPRAYAATAAELDRVLGARLLRPPPAGDGCAPTPNATTREDVRAAGAQVIVVSGCGPAAAWRGAVFDWDAGDGAHVESGSAADLGEACTARFDRQTYDTRVVRFFEDSTWVGATAAGAQAWITPEVAAAMARCGVDLVGLDQLLLGDGRLEALVWSWAPGEPRRAGCATQRDDGRWTAIACAGRRPAACRTPTGWTTTGRVPRPRAARACARAGARFAPPRTGRENALLRAPGAWLAVRARSPAGG